jgi:glycosyltransferase involved in cell wall biosynthesis
VQIKVLHLDSGPNWRGGQQQLATLLANLAPHQVESHVVLPLEVSHGSKFKAVHVLLHKNMRPFGQLKSALELGRYCTLTQIDLIHAHSSKAHTLAMLINLFRRKKLPLIVHRNVEFLPTNFALQRYKYSPRVVTQFIAISDAVKKALLGYGLYDSQITTIKSSYAGARLEPEAKQEAKQQLASSYGFNPEKPLVGFCSALTPEKGIFDLIAALSQLRRSSGECPQVLIAGEGPLGEKLQSELVRLKLQDKVLLMGFVSNTPGFFAALDILVFPSTSEGLGLTLLEAAFGLCSVVATRVGGISEVIIHEKTGLLAAPQQPREISKALALLLSNPLLRLKYALNLRAHVRKNFSPSSMGLECARLYRRVLGRSNSGPLEPPKALTRMPRKKQPK